LKVFKDLSKDRTQKYDPEKTSRAYTILSVTLFSINCNKTHKARLNYEIKCDLYKIAQKI